MISVLLLYIYVQSLCIGTTKNQYEQSPCEYKSRVYSGLFKYLGRENAPVTLTFKYLGSTEIESLTMQNAYIITAILAILPVVVCAAVGAVVLIRRRYS